MDCQVSKMTAQVPEPGKRYVADRACALVMFIPHRLSGLLQRAIAIDVCVECRGRDAKAPGDFGGIRLRIGQRRYGHVEGFLRHLPRTAAQTSPGAGCCQASTGPFSNQLCFKLRQRSENTEVACPACFREPSPLTYV